MSMISSPCRRCWRPTGSAPEGGLASDSPVGGWGSPRSGGDNDKRRGYNPSTTRHPLHNTPSPPQHAIPSTTRHPLHLGQVGRSGPLPSSAQARSGTHFKHASPLRHPLRARKHAHAPPFRARKHAHAPHFEHASTLTPPISSAQARSRPFPAPRSCSGEASNPRSQR